MGFNLLTLLKDKKTATMMQRTSTIRINEYLQLEELPDHLQELCLQAKKASHNAYSPYSGFSVGAALKLEDGSIFTGNNQENGAYPSGMCAERVALNYAGATKPDAAPVALAIAAARDGEFQKEPVTPCGACRQVMFESELRGGKDMEIVLYGSRKIQVLKRASDLLPLPFILDDNDTED